MGHFTHLDLGRGRLHPELERKQNFYNYHTTHNGAFISVSFEVTRSIRQQTFGPNFLIRRSSVNTDNNNILFLDLQWKYLDQKLMSYAMNQLKLIYSFRMELCSNEPTQFCAFICFTVVCTISNFTRAMIEHIIHQHRRA